MQRKKTISKIASYFVPYPAIHHESNDGQHYVELIDFSEIKVERNSLDEAISDASVLLLKQLAAREIINVFFLVNTEWDATFLADISFIPFI